MKMKYVVYEIERIKENVKSVSDYMNENGGKCFAFEMANFI